MPTYFDGWGNTYFINEEPWVTTTTANTVWPSWVNQYNTACTTVSNTVIWNTWTTGTSSTMPTQYFQNTTLPTADWETQRRRNAHAARQVAAERKRASLRARKLLLANLSRVQRRQYKANKRFDVIGGTTGRRYRIREGHVGNIDVYQDEQIVHRLCCHIPTNCPGEDIMLAQALHLAANEDEFVKTANVHRVR